MTSAVSVVIPVCNGERFLRPAIESLLAQTISDVPLICIDDASTDDSVAVARQAGRDRIVVLQNSDRIGLARNWNRAFEVTGTEYVLIAHQDDVYEPRYLERMLALLTSRPGAFAAHCRAFAIDESGRPLADPAARYKERFWSNHDPMERDPDEELSILRRGNYVIAPSVLLRRSAVDLIGHFDPRYTFVTDWDYWLRGLMMGFTFVGAQSRLIHFRRHAQTTTRQQERTRRRYEEELELLRTLQDLRPTSKPFVALENTLFAGFIEHLAEGNRSEAAALVTFACDAIPRFRTTFRARLMRAALVGGRVAGSVLKGALGLYLARGEDPR